MAVWLVRAGKRAKDWEAFRAGGYVGIGFGLLEDLTDEVSPPDFRDAYHNGLDHGSDNNGPNQIWQFLWVIRQGDTIFTPTQRGGSPILVGTVVGARPIFDNGDAREGGYPHRWKVEWKASPIPVSDHAISIMDLNWYASVHRIADSLSDLLMQLASDA